MTWWQWLILLVTAPFGVWMGGYLFTAGAIAKFEEHTKKLIESLTNKRQKNGEVQKD